MLGSHLKVSILALLVTTVAATSCRPIGEEVANAAPAQQQTAVEPEAPAQQVEAANDEAEAPAPATAPSPAAAGEGAREIASYAIPDASPQAVGRLVVALGDDPGLVSAEVDNEANQLQVTFTPGVTNPQTILSALTEVEPRVSFVGVRGTTDAAEPPPGHDCGSCPMRHQCQHDH